MRFDETLIKGAYIIDIEPIVDERGFFSRTFCQDEFESRSLCSTFVQCNISYNYKKGTVRGMHYQSAPHEEVKVVSCTQGSMYDVIIDLRPDSASYLKWFSVELTTANKKMFYIPAGCAHGFQTLEDDTQVFYQMGNRFEPSAAKGICWNDPMFNIHWPLDCELISEKDRSYERFTV